MKLDCDGPLSLLPFQEKLNLSCVHSPAVAELMRGIRAQMEGLITGLPPREISAMSLGLAHRWETLVCGYVWKKIKSINKNLLSMISCVTE